MSKLKQIEALVEEAHEKLRMVGGINPDQQPYCMEILTDLAKRSAEIGDVDQPALQPLPEQMPEWVNSAIFEVRRGKITPTAFYMVLCQHFGTQPREWWMDLKTGDKFMYGKNAYEFDAILLRTVNDYTYNIDNCSPYTDPEAQLRKTLNPDQIKLLDEMKANTKA